MNPTGRGAVFLGGAACLGCSSDNLPPTEDEFGEVGETSETEDPEPGSGPHGSGCDENWYSLDGLPVEQQGELPEFASLAETPSECFHKSEHSTCESFCVSIGSECAENACAGGTYLIHAIVDWCMDPTKDGVLIEHGCSEPIDWQVNEAAQCCCEQ